MEDLSKEGAFPISVEIDLAIEDAITLDQGSELLHILREAIQNSVQYSQAKKGKVNVKVSESLIFSRFQITGKGLNLT